MLSRLLSPLFLALLIGTAHASAPDIALSALDGTPRNVNEFVGKGKWVTVVFWAHNCTICASEIHKLNAFHAKHRNTDAIVLGVSVDGAAYLQQARKFEREHRLQFTSLLTEPDTDAFKRFGGGSFVGTPTHYFYDPIGRIVGRKIGPISGEDVEAFMEAFNNSSHAIQPPKSAPPAAKR